MILTPSKWSRDGFIASGADPKRVLIVPHGADPEIYHPLEDEARQELRDQMGCRGFIFLSVGAMTKNKGLSLLLKAFAAVIAKASACPVGDERTGCALLIKRLPS